MNEEVFTLTMPEADYSIPCNMINCFCMFSDYIPLTLDDWIRLDKERRVSDIRQPQTKSSC